MSDVQHATLANQDAMRQAQVVLSGRLTSGAIGIGLVLLGMYGSGAWYMATQNASSLRAAERMTESQAVMLDRVNTSSTAVTERLSRLETSVTDRLARMESAVGTRIDVVDRRDDVRAAAIAGIETRLTKIEAQIGFLIANQPVAGQGARR